MKTLTKTPLVKVVTLLYLLAVNSLLGAAFDSGSTGTNGALVVTNNLVLDMPPDGVFNYTTITIRGGTTLSFRTNALNTPVYLLAQGDVVLENDARIYLSGTDNNRGAPGAGGPGGFAGGFASHQGYPAGDGQGPGGGTQANGYAAVFAFPRGD